MITIYGASDDLVEVDGAVGANPEEYNVYGSDGKVHWRADFIGPGNPGYSAKLTINAPAGTRIRNIWPAPAGDPQ